MSSKGMSSEQFEAMRKKLVEAEYVTKTVPLSAIKMDAKGFKRNEIEVAGAPVTVSKGFFSKLAQMLKLSSSLTNTFLKNEDGKIAVALMNGLKDYHSSHGANEVLLVANPATKEVIDIIDPKRFRRLSNETVLDITSRIMNDSPNLSIETIDFNPGTGKTVINLLNNEEISFSKAGPDEFFKFGFSIVQTSRGTTTEQYNQRLVCSNGMRGPLGGGTIGGDPKGPRFIGGFSLKGTSADQIQEFLQNVENMRKGGFIPGAFGATLEAATKTKASLMEVEVAMNIAKGMVVEEIPDIKKQMVDAVGRNYFEGYNDAIIRLHKKGYEPARLSDKQKSYVKTSQSIWEVVNSLTFLGSNNSGFNMERKADLKFQGGKLFAKGIEGGFDLQFAELAGV